MCKESQLFGGAGVRGVYGLTDKSSYTKRIPRREDSAGGIGLVRGRTPQTSRC